MTRDPPELWRERFVAEGCDVVDPAPVHPDADWWAVDGYALGEPGPGPAGAGVVRIDDHDGAGTGGAGADLVVDQNLEVDPTSYRGARAVLLGPRYALLRRDMHEPHAVTPVPDAARRVVVVLGGSPTAEVRALGHAVASDGRLGHLDVRVLDGSVDVAPELAAADVALAAAGIVAWELCCRGVPTVLVAVAANQAPVAQQLADAGAADRVEPDPEAIVIALAALAGDARRRADMARVGRSLVDGLGARRVACRLRSHLLTLRDVREVDAALLHEWSNDPGTRAASFSSSPIPWDEHLAWLTARLARPASASYIASDSLKGAVGLVRFDQGLTGSAEIGVTVAPERQGEGWGGALVDAGCRRWAAGRGAVRVDALVKVGNEASVRAFVDADFDAAASDDPHVLRYARHLDGDERRS